MGYLPSFAEDIFISYAHNDDDAYAMEPQGWVAQLDEDLRKRVAVFLDGQKPAVWRDREIRGNEDFEEIITRRLIKTATLISIISPSFFQRKWCLRELEEFATCAERDFGVKVGEKNRIFKVEKVPLSFERGYLPDSLQGTGSYRFYGPDPQHEGRIHEYRPKLGVDYAARYWRELDDLAQDIAMVLKQMYARVHNADLTVEPATAIYVAEATSDLEDEAKEIRRDLKARGFKVLPEGDLPYRTKDLRTRVAEDLSRSLLSIHLIGSEYGLIPEGESQKSIAWLQSEYSIERQKKATGFARILWIPRGMAPADPRQQRFVEHLHNDSEVQQGADLTQSRLEELKTLVQEKISVIRSVDEKKALPQAAARERKEITIDEPLRIYVICDQLDLLSSDLGDLRNYLFTHGYECILPSENGDEAEALQEHVDNLEICDACLIYYGLGSDRWFGTKLRELRKLLSRRNSPVRAKGVYVAPPTTPCKVQLQTLEAMVLRGSKTFTGTILIPFLEKLGTV